VVANSHAIGVAGEIGEDLFWPGERSLGKDHPLLVGGAREMRLERRRCIQSHAIAEKLQFAGGMDEQAAEQRESTSTGTRNLGWRAIQRS